MYSTRNEGKFVIAEKFIRTLKYIIYEYMTSISKNVYIDILDDVGKKYNKTYSRIKLKPVDVKPSTYIDSTKKIIYQHPKFKTGHIIRISNIKIFSQKAMFQVGLKNFSLNIFPQTYVISDIKGKKIVGTFYKKELQKTNQKERRAEKVIKRKGSMLYVKWKQQLDL